MPELLLRHFVFIMARKGRERRRKPVRGTGISSQGRERIVSMSEAIMKQTTPDRVPARQPQEI